MTNSLRLIGNVGQNPRIERPRPDFQVATFFVAWNNSRIDRSTGARVEGETNWFQVRAYDAMAERVMERLSSGDQVMLDASVRNQKWQDKEGHDQYSSFLILENFRVIRKNEGKKPGVEVDEDALTLAALMQESGLSIDDMLGVIDLAKAKKLGQGPAGIDTDDDGTLEIPGCGDSEHPDIPVPQEPEIVSTQG